MAQPSQGRPASQAGSAPAQQPPAQQRTAAKPPAKATVGLVGELLDKALVVARPVFERVVEQDALPIMWDSELDFAKRLFGADATGRLAKCTPDSVRSAMQNLAHVGLTLNPLKQHATLIARWNDGAGIMECTLLPMYRGLVYLATQAGVHDIVADVVYQSDEFNVIRTSEGDRFEHKIDVRTTRLPEAFQGCYVAARMPASNMPKVEWVPKEDIYRMREQSDSYKDSQGNIRPGSPWVRWFDEQAKKSSLKRASKRWEEAIDHGSRWQRFQTAVDLDHKAEGGGRTIEGEATRVDEPKLSVEQIAAIEAAASELHVRDVPTWLGKVCQAYGVQVLADVPAGKHQEILDRIKHAKDEAEKRKGKK